MFLPDVNLWLALAVESHVHHASAQTWFDSSTGECFYCRLTQQGFLRLVTNPKALFDEAVSLPEAWRIYDSFLGDSRVIYAEEPPGVEPLWRGYTQGETFSPKIWSDAYLAAFAEAARLELVTFDKGFSRFKNLTQTILS